MATEEEVIQALKQVHDPELMVNVVDLGLVYKIDLHDDVADVEMTLTSPACPAGPEILQQSKFMLEQLEGIRQANVQLVMSPPWTPERMTEEARDQLGMF
jgi:metal-sulfur cluster biosynthetic enzyme